MNTMGYKEDEYNLDVLYQDLKLVDRKGAVFDYDLEALMHFSNLGEGRSLQIELPQCSVW